MLNKRLAKIVKTLQDGINPSVRRDQIKKALEEGGFDFIIDRPYDEVYDIESKRIAATIENVSSYYLSGGTMWANLKNGGTQLEITIKYGYSYIDLIVEINKQEEKTIELDLKEVEISENVEIIFNEEKSGIELHFNSKPTKEVITVIKDNGFRAAKRSGKWFWYAKDSQERRCFVETLVSKEEVEEVQEEKLIDCRDCNDINTLKEKYVSNWNELPQEIQDYIMSCNRWWVSSSQEVLIYKGNRIEASLSIDLWEAEIKITYLGSGSLQWSLNTMRDDVVKKIESEGFVLNPSNMIWYKQEQPILKSITLDKIEVIEAIKETDSEIEQIKLQAERLQDISFSVISKNNLAKTWSCEEWQLYKKLMKEEMKKNNFELSRDIIYQLDDEYDLFKQQMIKLLDSILSIQDQFDEAELKQGDKITIIQLSDFIGVSVINTTVESLEHSNYAQYDDAINLIHKPKRKRDLRKSYLYKKDIVVYKGWVNFSNELLMDIVKSNDKVTVKKSRYMSCDIRALDEVLNYFNDQNIKPIINTYRPE